ncbi:hypothetical protein VNO78_20734 [Psophocarpus tetragonolobus]|uniref:Uncharacterized protein n=1 Tax=Psophocarpus tetragonolobus TaxID=3891 RepID=A0AAN9SBY9_PSOTE
MKESKAKFIFVRRQPFDSFRPWAPSLVMHVSSFCLHVFPLANHVDGLMSVVTVSCETTVLLVFWRTLDPFPITTPLISSTHKNITFTQGTF